MAVLDKVPLLPGRGLWAFFGDFAPTASPGVQAPIGSEFTRTDTGGFYKKTGSGATSWTLQSGGGGGGSAPIADNATSGTVRVNTADAGGDPVVYRKGEVDTLLSAKADSSALSGYATTSALTSGLAGKSDTSHTHDSRYYTETEVDSLLSGKADSSALTSGLAGKEPTITTLSLAKGGTGANLSAAAINQVLAGPASGAAGAAALRALVAADIPGLDAAKIISGVLGTALLPRKAAVVTSNVTNASTAVASITGLSFPIAVGETWLALFLYSFRTTVGTTGHKFAWNFPAGVSGRYIGFGNNAAATYINPTSTAIGTLSAVFGSAVAINTDLVALFGLWVTGATSPGTIQAQFAAGGASTTSQINAGSLMLAFKV